jgi:hypothetical protein
VNSSDVDGLFLQRALPQHRIFRLGVFQDWDVAIGVSSRG